MTQLPQKKNVFTLLRAGQHYSKSWPNKESGLAAVFPEHHVIKAVQFGIRFMPPVAIFTLGWQVSLSGQFGPAVATALFACSLPIQGLWWLGRRATTELPLSLVEWYGNIQQQLASVGHAIESKDSKLTYQDLADILKIAFQKIDKAFLDEL